MKKYFINVSFEAPEIKIPDVLKEKKVGLVCSVQYINQLYDVQKQLPNAVMGGQVVGCNASRALAIKDQVDCFFFVGEGRFHAIEVAVRTGKEVFIASGDKITDEEINAFKKEVKTKQLKFLHAQKVGILVSIKPGQYNLNMALTLKKKLKDKECVIFMDDMFNLENIENFNDIDIFVNTACSRIVVANVINAEDLPEY